MKHCRAECSDGSDEEDCSKCIFYLYHLEFNAKSLEKLKFYQALWTIGLFSWIAKIMRIFLFTHQYFDPQI